MPKRANNQRNTRRTKIDSNIDTSDITPLNNKQREYIKVIQHNSVVICTGVLGSSKTYIPAVIAADMLLNKEIDRIVIARPAEGRGKSVGFLPGTKDEKLLPWCAPVTETIKKRVGTGNFEAFLHNGRIELLDLTNAKGRTYDDTFLIIDEAEDLEPDVAKTLVTRHGQNTKMVITGDVAQQDLKATSGLQVLLQVSKYTSLPIPHIDFDSWDYCVRSEESKMWGMAFEQWDKSENGWK